MTHKKLVFLGVLGLADCTPGREPHSVAASFQFNIKSVGDRVLKSVQHLAKLWTRVGL